MILEEESRTAAHSPARQSLRAVGALIVIAAGVLVVGLLWNETRSAVAPSAMQTFLVLWLVAGALTIISDARLLTVAPVVRLTVVGIALGAGLASTTWENFALSGWWQLWLSVPLLLGQVRFHTRRRSNNE